MHYRLPISLPLYKQKTVTIVTDSSSSFHVVAQFLYSVLCAVGVLNILDGCMEFAGTAHALKRVTVLPNIADEFMCPPPFPISYLILKRSHGWS